MCGPGVPDVRAHASTRLGDRDGVLVVGVGNG